MKTLLYILTSLTFTCGALAVSAPIIVLPAPQPAELKLAEAFLNLHPKEVTLGKEKDRAIADVKTRRKELLVEALTERASGINLSLSEYLMSLAAVEDFTIFMRTSDLSTLSPSEVYIFHIAFSEWFRLLAPNRNIRNDDYLFEEINRKFFEIYRRAGVDVLW